MCLRTFLGSLRKSHKKRTVAAGAANRDFRKAILRRTSAIVRIGTMSGILIVCTIASVFAEKSIRFPSAIRAIGAQDRICSTGRCVIAAGLVWCKIRMILTEGDTSVIEFTILVIQ